MGLKLTTVPTETVEPATPGLREAVRERLGTEDSSQIASAMSFAEMVSRKADERLGLDRPRTERPLISQDNE